jgi:hypothetical protein
MLIEPLRVPGDRIRKQAEVVPEALCDHIKMPARFFGRTLDCALDALAPAIHRLEPAIDGFEPAIDCFEPAIH